MSIIGIPNTASSNNGHYVLTDLLCHNLVGINKLALHAGPPQQKTRIHPRYNFKYADLLVGTVGMYRSRTKMLITEDTCGWFLLSTRKHMESLRIVDLPLLMNTCTMGTFINRNDSTKNLSPCPTQTSQTERFEGYTMPWWKCPPRGHGTHVQPLWSSSDPNGHV